MEKQERGRPTGTVKGETEYEKSINRLIPEANKHTDNLIKRSDYPESKFGEDWYKIWGDDWSMVFHYKMDELAALAGSRGTRKYKKAA